MYRKLFVLALLSIGGFGPVTSLPTAAQSGGWNHRILWNAGEKIQGVTLGDVDPDRDGIEGVAVTMSGAVGIGGLSGGSGVWSEVIYTHTAKLNTAFVADMDPSIPGNELYLGGGSSEEGGELLQAWKSAGKWRVKSIWKGAGFVHTIARLPAEAGEGPVLIFPTYAGEIVSLALLSSGSWKEDVLYRESLESDSNRLLMKDLVVGRVGGLDGWYVFAGSKAGRGLLININRPGSAELLHEETGGMARINMDDDGTVYCACNNGNILQLQRSGGIWRVDTLFRATDELRGVAPGRFPGMCETASVAGYGYSGFVHILAPNGIGWNAYPIFRDTDRAHSLSVGDAIPGNEGDEILIGGYSGKLMLLVAE